MAPKSIRKAINDALDDLVDEDLERFCFQLLDNEGQRVKESLVMGKSRGDITSALIETYTEEGALKVVLQTLRDIEFKREAQDLVEDTEHLTSSTPSSSGVVFLNRAPKSIKKAINDALEDLKDEDLEKFCHQLVHYNGKRIKRSLVMGKSRVQITSALIKTYTEEGALKVVLQTLRDIGLNSDVMYLVEDTEHLTSSTPSSSGVVFLNMAQKSIKKAINDALEDLEDEDLEKFCYQLLMYEGKLVKRSLVIGKSRVQITSLLIETYTEEGALKVVLQTLRDIGLNIDADFLVADTEHLTSSTPSSSGAAEASGGAAGGPANATSSGPTQNPEQTLESIRVEFISRVSDPSLRDLLDRLLDKQLITHPEMESAQTLNKAEKVRQVFDTVQKKGPKASSALIAALCEVDPCVSRQLKLM